MRRWWRKRRVWQGRYGTGDPAHCADLINRSLPKLDPALKRIPRRIMQTSRLPTFIVVPFLSCREVFMTKREFGHDERPDRRLFVGGALGILFGEGLALSLADRARA